MADWKEIETAPRGQLLLLFGTPYGEPDPILGAPTQFGVLTDVEIERWDYDGPNTQRRKFEKKLECSAWMTPTHWDYPPEPPHKTEEDA